jgi:hypothetical protein
MGLRGNTHTHTHTHKISSRTSSVLCPKAQNRQEPTALLVEIPQKVQTSQFGLSPYPRTTHPGH